MCRRIVLVFAVIGVMALFNTSPVFCQEKTKEWVLVDLNTLDCRALLKTTDRERDLMVAFYHGVVTGTKKEMTANVPVLSEVTDKVIDQCIDNPKENLLKVFQEKRR